MRYITACALAILLVLLGAAFGPAVFASPSAASQVVSAFAGYSRTTTSKTINSAHATITVPTVTCHNTVSAQVALWVGISAGRKTLEQDGLYIHCVKSQHNKPPHPIYRAFWDMFPGMFPRGFRYAIMTIRPGDQVSATVSFKDKIFRLALLDKRNHQTSVTLAGCAAHETCGRTQAEWYAEDLSYESNGQRLYYPLVDWEPAMLFDAVTANSTSFEKLKPVAASTIAINQKHSSRTLALPTYDSSHLQQFEILREFPNIL